MKDVGSVCSRNPLNIGMFFLNSESRVRIRNEVIDFVVQYETLINGKWFPVVRYDTSHGFAHRDLLNLKGEKRKTPIFVSDKNDALTFAENDIKDNWEVYKQRFIQEAKR